MRRRAWGAIVGRSRVAHVPCSRVASQMRRIHQDLMVVGRVMLGHGMVSMRLWWQPTASALDPGT